LIAASAIVAAAGLAWVAPAATLTASPNPGSACGTAAQSVITTDYETSARNVYQGELVSPEVTADLRRVTSSTALRRALASGDRAMVQRATHKIVYTPRWHIVRLRVLSPSGRLLADVGGPYVLAPVTRQLTYHGAVVGSFVLSVQDDLGYEKLVTRFTALPIEMYRSGAPLMGMGFPTTGVPPTVPADGTAITVNGVASVTVSYSVLAFPTGTYRVLLAIPAATAALRAASCAEVNAETYGEISVHVAALLDLRKDAGFFVTFDREFTANSLTFVRRGSNQLASSDGLPGPPAIPSRGSVHYEGETWLAYSFNARRGVRVSLLFPDTAPGTGSSGPSGPSGATGPTAATGAS
jgi:hypothetical protein